MDNELTDPIKIAEAPVMVVGPAVKLPAPAQVGDINVAPNTTAAEDLETAGQRWVNRLWEGMQALLAALVIGVMLFVASRIALLVVVDDATEGQVATANAAFMLMGNLASLIIGFYFGRTNHTKTGGVSPKTRGE